MKNQTSAIDYVTHFMNSNFEKYYDVLSEMIKRERNNKLLSTSAIKLLAHLFTLRLCLTAVKSGLLVYQRGQIFPVIFSLKFIPQII